MPEYPLKQRFVLDTSVFITEEIRRDGESLEDAVSRFLDLIARAKLELNISCYLPPSIYEELSRILADRGVGEAVFADLLESDDAYLLVLDLPGVSAESTDVRAERGRLRIEARREKDLPPEYRYVDEDRSLFLDAEIPLPPDASDAGGTGHLAVAESGRRPRPGRRPARGSRAGDRDQNPA